MKKQNSISESFFSNFLEEDTSAGVYQCGSTVPIEGQGIRGIVNPLLTKRTRKPIKEDKDPILARDVFVSNLIRMQVNTLYKEIPRYEEASSAKIKTMMKTFCRNQETNVLQFLKTKTNIHKEMNKVFPTPQIDEVLLKHISLDMEEIRRKLESGPSTSVVVDKQPAAELPGIEQKNDSESYQSENVDQTPLRFDKTPVSEAKVVPSTSAEDELFMEEEFGDKLDDPLFFNSVIYSPALVDNDLKIEEPFINVLDVRYDLVDYFGRP
eukprot:TRINITY_DN1427_c0_g1_i14.p1 TRINITY_DN1427_c0_g1~~TRINITY_DN1427_c0_g1_i14.p1  ORF type:complete len:267 (+),score=61.61 TRINITY_DN1427_c0_g1_i14:118-918(+)